MSNYAKQLEEKKELEKQLRMAQKAIKKDALSEIKSIIKSAGLSYADLMPLLPEKKVAKYKNPSTGETWSGRGKAPAWIKGKDRSQFLIITGN